MFISIHKPVHLNFHIFDWNEYKSPTGDGVMETWWEKYLRVLQY